MPPPLLFDLPAAARVMSWCGETGFFLPQLRVALPQGDHLAALIGEMSSLGFRPLLFGGAVRDALMGHPLSGDLDLAFEHPQGPAAAPLQAQALAALAQSQGLRLWQAGPKLLRMEGKGVRWDLKTPICDGRHLAYRADLGIGGLLYDLAEDTLVDLIGGVDDIQQQRLRILCVPLFITELPRLVRLFRLSNKLGWPLTEEHLAIARLFHPMVNFCGHHQVWSGHLELLKLLSQPDPYVPLSQLIDTRVLTAMLPELTASLHFPPEAPQLVENLFRLSRILPGEAPGGMALDGDLAGVNALGIARFIGLWLHAGDALMATHPEAHYVSDQERYAGLNPHAYLTLKLIYSVVYRYPPEHALHNLMQGVLGAVIEANCALGGLVVPADLRPPPLDGSLEGRVTAEALNMLVQTWGRHAQHLNKAAG